MDRDERLIGAVIGEPNIEDIKNAYVTRVFLCCTDKSENMERRVAIVEGCPPYVNSKGEKITSRAFYQSSGTSTEHIYGDVDIWFPVEAISVIKSNRGYQYIYLKPNMVYENTTYPNDLMDRLGEMGFYHHMQDNVAGRFMSTQNILISLALSNLDDEQIEDYVPFRLVARKTGKIPYVNLPSDEVATIHQVNEAIGTNNIMGVNFNQFNCAFIKAIILANLQDEVTDPNLEEDLYIECDSGDFPIDIDEFEDMIVAY